MPDELETILRLVADGRLSPEEAAPIIDALTRAAHTYDPVEDEDDEIRSPTTRGGSITRSIGRSEASTAPSRALRSPSTPAADASCVSRSRRAAASG